MTKNIYLTEDIDSEIMSEIIKEINKYNEQSAITLKYGKELLEGFKNNEPLEKEELEEMKDVEYSMEEALEPIHIHVSSGGGDVWATWAIVGAMERSVLPIVTWGYGIVGSGALAIFATGDSRHMSKHASLMYHAVAFESQYQKLKDHENGVILAKNMQKTYSNIITNNSDVPIELLDKSVSDSVDLYFTSEEALNYNLIENIF